MSRLQANECQRDKTASSSIWPISLKKTTDSSEPSARAERIHCWLSSTEQEAVVTMHVREPEKQVSKVSLGSRPAVARRREKQSSTWAALHVIQLRISPVRLCVQFWKTQEGSTRSQKKKLTTGGSKAEQPERLWLGLILGFSWVIFLHSCGKLS